MVVRVAFGIDARALIDTPLSAFLCRYRWCSLLDAVRAAPVVVTVASVGLWLTALVVGAGARSFAAGAVPEVGLRPGSGARAGLVDAIT